MSTIIPVFASSDYQHSDKKTQNQLAYSLTVPQNLNVKDWGLETIYQVISCGEIETRRSLFFTDEKTLLVFRASTSPLKRKQSRTLKYKLILLNGNCRLENWSFWWKNSSLHFLSILVFKNEMRQIKVFCFQQTILYIPSRTKLTNL